MCAIKALLLLCLATFSNLCGLPCSAAAASATPAQPFPRPGEWPAYRCNKTLDGHAAGRGDICTTPTLVWRQYIGRTRTAFQVVPGPNGRAIHAPCDRLNRRPSGEAWDTRWMPGMLYGEVEGRRRPIPYSAGDTTYYDLLPDSPGLEKIYIQSGFNFGKAIPPGTVPTAPLQAFRWQNGQWVKFWESEPIERNFGNYPLVGDFDGDGQPEIAVIPWYQMRIYDARNGKLKYACRYTRGRSYGFFGHYDLDGDGRQEFLIMSDHTRHVNVLGFRAGRLVQLWADNFEPDILYPEKVMRVLPAPAVHLTSPRTRQVIMNLFNGEGDNRWHTVIREGIDGTTQANLNEEIAQGSADLDGDGIDELLTIKTNGMSTPSYGTIRVWSIKGSAPLLLWEGRDMAWQTFTAPVTDHTQNHATLGGITVLGRAINGRATVLVRAIDRRGCESVASCRWRDGALRPDVVIEGHDIQVTGIDGQGCLLGECLSRPDEQRTVRVRGGIPKTLYSEPTGLLGVGEPALICPAGQSRPTVIAQGFGEELVLFHPPGQGQPARELRRLAGRGQTDRWPAIFSPVAADLMGDGQRQIVYATEAPGGPTRLVVEDLSGREIWHRDFPLLPGNTPPGYNTDGIIFWQAGHFTDPGRSDLLVSFRRMMTHCEVCLLSGKDGREIWHRDRQISGHGVGGQLFAIADYFGTGLDGSASFMGRIRYILDGQTGKDLLARENFWHDLPLRPVYWGIPIAGRFDDSGSPSLLFCSSGHTMIGRIRPSGDLAWSGFYSEAPVGMAAVGDFDGDSRRDTLFADAEKGILCLNPDNGKVQWQIPLASEARKNPATIMTPATGDLNGDGRDEAVYLIGSSLHCFGTAGPGTPGRRLWTVNLPASTTFGPPILADPVDGSGRHLSILLCGLDGYVYCVR